MSKNAKMQTPTGWTSANIYVSISPDREKYVVLHQFSKLFMDLNSGNLCQMKIFRFLRPHTVSAASVLQDTIFNMKFSWISFRIFLFQVIKLNDVGHLVDKFEYISDPDDLTGLNDLISHENLSDLDDLDCLFDFKK